MLKLKLTIHSFANTVLLEGVQNIPSTSEQEIINFLVELIITYHRALIIKFYFLTVRQQPS